MKTKLSLTLIFVLWAQGMGWAQSSEYINYFIVASKMAQPVTIVTNLGSFTFSGTYTVKGRIESIEAVDINGDRIVVSTPTIKDGKTVGNVSYIEYYYTLNAFQKGSSTYMFDDPDSRDHNPYYFSAGLGEPQGFMAKNYEEWRRKLYVGVGYGLQYGGAWGANLTAKAAHGAIGITGGIGVDKRDVENDSPTWYTALLTGYGTWDVEVGVTNRYLFSRSSRVLDLVVMSNLNFAIYRPFGLNIGIGYCLTADMPVGNIGLTVRLHQAERRSKQRK